MNNKNIFILFFLIGISLTIISCDATEPKEDGDYIHVMFSNKIESDATITSIFIQPMGIIDRDSILSETTIPKGDWSDNILANNKVIAPGKSRIYTLPIPKSHWSRLLYGIDNGTGKEILLYEESTNHENFNVIFHPSSVNETMIALVILRDKYNKEGYRIVAYSDYDIKNYFKSSSNISSNK